MADDQQTQTTQTDQTDQQQTQTTQQSQEWYSSLGADLSANPSITKFKSPADMAKSYVELQKALGKEKVILPTDKSTPEEWNQFFRKIGAPEKADDYDVGDEELPEQIRPSKELKENFRKQMHEAGYTKKQFEKAWKFYKESTLNSFNQQMEGIKQMRGKSEEELRGEWGAAYDTKVDAAQKVINTFFKDKGIRPEFSVLANDKGFIKAMADIAESLGEDKIGGTRRSTLTPDEATSELNAILGDKNHPYWKELDPAHNIAVDRVLELQQMTMSR